MGYLPVRVYDNPAGRVANPVNLLIAINLHERVAHPAFFWRGGGFLSAGGPPRQLIDRNKLTSEGGPSRLLLAGWGFSSGNLLTTRVKPKHPPGQNQPGWATHNIRRPSQSNHPTQSNVSRVTAPSLPEPLT